MMEVVAVGPYGRIGTPPMEHHNCGSLGIAQKLAQQHLELAPLIRCDVASVPSVVHRELHKHQVCDEIPASVLIAYIFNVDLISKPFQHFNAVSLQNGR